MPSINDIIRSTSKRLPIVLCLDVSQSMKQEYRIEQLNEVFRSFINRLQDNRFASRAADISIVTFGSNIIEEGRKFEPVFKVLDRTFEAVENTECHLSEAILHSVKLLENRLVIYDENDIDCYYPYLVVITGGDPDSTDLPDMREKAIQSILKHCDSSRDEYDLLVPYIIGVGNDISSHCEVLNQMSTGFTGQAIQFDGDDRSLESLLDDMFNVMRMRVVSAYPSNYDMRKVYNAMKEQACYHLQENQTDTSVLHNETNTSFVDE